MFMIAAVLLVGLGQCDREITPAVVLVECDERLHVKGTISFPQTQGKADCRVPARRVLDWPRTPGIGASADLVGAVDVCRCGKHVGVTLLEFVGRIGILCGLGLHHVGKARWLSNSTCNS
jgi:hypothetical protein